MSRPSSDPSFDQQKIRKQVRLAAISAMLLAALTSLAAVVLVGLAFLGGLANHDNPNAVPFTSDVFTRLAMIIAIPLAALVPTCIGGFMILDDNRRGVYPTLGGTSVLFAAAILLTIYLWPSLISTSESLWTLLDIGIFMAVVGLIVVVLIKEIQAYRIH